MWVSVKRTYRLSCRHLAETGPALPTSSVDPGPPPRPEVLRCALVNCLSTVFSRLRFCANPFFSLTNQFRLFLLGVSPKIVSIFVPIFIIEEWDSREVVVVPTIVTGSEWFYDTLVMPPPLSRRALSAGWFASLSRPIKKRFATNPPPPPRRAKSAWDITPGSVSINWRNKMGTCYVPKCESIPHLKLRLSRRGHH